MSSEASDQPSVIDLARRAREIFLERLARGVECSPEDDWLQAERDLGSLPPHPQAPTAPFARVRA